MVTTSGLRIQPNAWASAATTHIAPPSSAASNVRQHVLHDRRTTSVGVPRLLHDTCEPVDDCCSTNDSRLIWRHQNRILSYEPSERLSVVRFHRVEPCLVTFVNPFSAHIASYPSFAVQPHHPAERYE